MAKKTSIGGQAVIEGIMMKGPNKTALAVRIPDGTIDVEYVEEKHLKDKFSLAGWPIIRGCVNFVESLVSGYKALMKSADKSGFTDLEEENKKTKEPETEEIKEEINEAVESEEKDSKPKAMDKVTAIVMVVASVLGVGLSILLFMYLPAILFDLVNGWTGGEISGLKAVFEGILKMIIFFVYVLLVSQMKDIKRVFQYHGAEHKTIFCYEKGLDLTVENVKIQSRLHPRCGTSFMILMLVVGILLGIILTWAFPVLQQSAFRPIWVVIKILMLPLICGVGYEILKICGRHDNWLTRTVAAPGMWMQKITTKEPDEGMMELAIVSLKAVLPEKEGEDNW